MTIVIAKIGLVVAAVFAAGLYLFNLFTKKKTDDIIAQLAPEADQKKKAAYDAQLAQAQKDIEDAKIRYDNSRRNLDNK